MIEQLEKYLYCKDNLRNNINKLKEVFIEFYGEDKREEIEKKFNNALFFAYMNPDKNKEILKEISKIHINNILYKEIGDFNIKCEDLIGNIQYGINPLIDSPIAKFKEFYELYKLGKQGRLERFKEKGFNEIKKIISIFTKEEYDELFNTGIIPAKYNNLHPNVLEFMLYWAKAESSENNYKYWFLSSKNVFNSVKPEVTFENFEERLNSKDIQKLISIANHLTDLMDTHDELMKKYDNLVNNINLQDEIKNELNRKYYLLFIEENKDLLINEDLELLEEYKAGKRDSFPYRSHMNVLFQSNIEGQNLPMEAFSKKAEDRLLDDNVSKWSKDMIIQDRIKYFNSLNIKYGTDYEAYVGSEEAKKVWPSFERVDRFLESKNRLLNDFNNEFYTKLPSHLQGREEIEARGLLDKQDSYDAGLYTSGVCGSTFVSPNVRMGENGYELSPLVIICCNERNGVIDHKIIHELNHLYELVLNRCNGNFVEYTCGWEILSGKIEKNIKTVDTINTNTKKRSYELFNEIINEIIAQEIHQKVLEKGILLFDTKDSIKIKGYTSYEETFFLVADFYKEYKEDIIKSRENGNLKIIWNKVGKENFDDLNDLFAIYNENFAGFKKLRLMESIKKGEETDETRLYRELIVKRDKILERMREYSKKEEIDTEISM